MFGLRVRNEQGAVILDSGDFTYEVIFNEVLDWSGNTGPAAEVSYTITGFNPSTCVFSVFHEYPHLYDPDEDWSAPLPYIYPILSNVVTLRNTNLGDTSMRRYATAVFRLIAFRML